MPEDMTAKLLDQIRIRRKFDEKWALVNFIASQVFVGISIFASFGSAIVATANITSPLVVGILAAIPGTAIVIDRGFLFAARWRWQLLLV
ncbi:MAG: hypothetical protein UT30_C0047G0005 [Candidatus Uhrbacteria bacterium GW2011_GWF2_39_13]|uniref:Uncharacterized protein n=1 Tax=Candidatus Uhrbacteria bacterium GW2011_GWF2_39_13 TaxID=1618995 RepID=A0A0G0PXH1_9BACT|nr:MAG: hypothetical protein UT30_C0047G0005 [Candidatus Uhrbacteria bacterium GW2011_GWF2_39_13]